MTISKCYSRPTNFRIPNVPYHRQITNFACGAASFQMVYHYWGIDLDQRSIIDVARTSFAVGTNTDDLVRAGHFSYLSSTQESRYFPEAAPKHGWPKFPIGMASFGFRSNTECWIDELLEVVYQGFPIIVLNHFQVDDLEGHFRVVIGWEDDDILLLDPWDRTDWPRVVKFPRKNFCFMWSLKGRFDNYTAPSFWAGFVAPWKVDVQFDAMNTTSSIDERITAPNEDFITVSATITYPCPAPFCGGLNGTNASFPHNASSEIRIATDTYVLLDLPSTMQLAVNETTRISNQTLRINIGTLKPTESVSVKWDIAVAGKSLTRDSKESPFIAKKVPITVVASGEISSGTVKAYCCSPNIYFPAYNYTDRIGGTGTVFY